MNLSNINMIHDTQEDQKQNRTFSIAKTFVGLKKLFDNLNLDADTSSTKFIRTEAEVGMSI